MAKFSKKVYRNAWSSNSLLYVERVKVNLFILSGQILGGDFHSIGTNN